MRAPKPLNIRAVVAAVQAISPDARLQWIMGTIQRVDYQRRELSVIASGRAWHFALSPDCQLWFNGRRAPFRCFQPLDHARVFYETLEPDAVAEALYIWAEDSAGIE